MHRIAVALAMGICLMAGCSPSSSKSTPAFSAGVNIPTQAPTAAGSCTQTTATDLTSGPTVLITIKGFAYHPACFLAKLNGQKLSITNQDAVAHTFTVDGTPVNLSVPAGQTTTTSGSASDALTAGVHPFHCTIHPSITGTLILIG